jgi:predicted RNase H-like HicB family nuclease
MQRSYRFLVLIEQDEDGMYVASVPALRGCHTQAKSIEELLPRVREAIELCLEVEAEEIAPPLRFVGVQQIEVSYG